MLAAIGANPATWTVYYAAQAEMLRASSQGRLRHDRPPLRMPTFLALSAAGNSPALQALLGACRAASGD